MARKMLAVQMDDEKLEKFKDRCVENGTEHAKLIRDVLIPAYMENRLTINPTPNKLNNSTNKRIYLNHEY